MDIQNSNICFILSILAINILHDQYAPPKCTARPGPYLNCVVPLAVITPGAGSDLEVVYGQVK